MLRIGAEGPYKNSIVTLITEAPDGDGWGIQYAINPTSRSERERMAREWVHPRDRGRRRRSRWS